MILTTVLNLINLYSSAPLVPSASLPDLVEKVKPGVVNISVTQGAGSVTYGLDSFFRLWQIPQERKQVPLGSGFLIDSEGFAITNFHVVKDFKSVTLTFENKRELQAKVVGRDQKLDLALLKIVTDKPQAFVKLGDSDKVRIGESTFAVGNPFGLQHSVTAGIISAKNRSIGLGPFDNFFQTDASINPGNSGGPLFNFSGEVIGITTAIYSEVRQSAGVNFAIPSNEASKVLEALKRYGRIPRPWLGILGDRLTPGIRVNYGIAAESGVIVLRLVEDGPAERAGIIEGDIITKFEGKPVTDVIELERELAKMKPNDRAKLTIQRLNKEKTATLELKELPPSLKTIPEGLI